MDLLLEKKNSLFLQSIQTALHERSNNYRSNFVRGFFLKTTYQHKFLYDTSTKGNWAVCFLSTDIEFQCFLIVDKISEGYPLTKMVHLAFWLLKLLSMDFSSTISSSMDFLPTKPVSLPCICLKSVHLSFPSVKWFWFLFYQWWRQCSWILLQWNTISRSFQRWKTFWLLSNRFKWFPSLFSKQNDIHRILFNVVVSLGDSFNFFNDFPISRFCSQGLPIKEKAFFVFHSYLKEYPLSSRWWSWFS